MEGSLKDKNKPAKVPFGYFFVTGIIITLCIGGFGILTIPNAFEEDQSSPLDVSASTTPVVGITLASNTESFAALGDPTKAAPTVVDTSTPVSIDTSVPVVIPVTGGSCLPNNPPQTGRVVEVVDGDTIKVLLDQDGLVYSVRYIGMNTPEDTSRVEYFGPQATAKNGELVWGKTVTLIKDVSEIDPYGRLLRYVLVDDVFVNYELVAQGYANVASYPPDIACISTFQAVEQGASASKLGLWSAPPTEVVPTLVVVIPTNTLSSNGGNAVCNCIGPDLDCKDFNTHAAAQACYNYCVSQGYGDAHGLDGNDNDGLACESLP